MPHARVAGNRARPINAKHLRVAANGQIDDFDYRDLFCARVEPNALMAFPQCTLAWLVLFGCRKVLTRLSLLVG